VGLTLFDPQPTRYLFQPEVGALYIDGTRFKRADDESLFQWRGISAFLLFRDYCRGESIQPRLRWYRQMGFNMLRVFGPLPWKETPDYRVENFRYDLLPAFFAEVESFGLRINWSLCHYTHEGNWAYVQQWYDIASQFECCVAEAVNEPHNDGGEPTAANPTDRRKPDPIELLDGINRCGILTSYGYYDKMLDGKPGTDPVLDFGTVHTPKDDGSWHRKAKIVWDCQEATGKPWVSDEPAKIVEPGFNYPGSKDDPATTPREMCWHGGVCYLWTPGFTYHCEEGKWGRVPGPGMLQYTVAKAIRDNLFLKIDGEWQTGEYNHSGNGDSPVDDVDEKDGDPIWTYTSLHPNTALSVRCGDVPIKAKNGWRIADSWLNGTIARLER
jgi:hypothetical protein